jgi:hypothetical protein
VAVQRRAAGQAALATVDEPALSRGEEGVSGSAAAGEQRLFVRLCQQHQLRALVAQQHRIAALTKSLVESQAWINALCIAVPSPQQLAAAMAPSPNTPAPQRAHCD